MKLLPEWVRIPLPKSRDNVVPSTRDVDVITEILDHSSLADVQDGLNLEPRGPWLRLHKEMKTWVLTPSKIWHSPVEEKRKSVTKSINHQ